MHLTGVILWSAFLGGVFLAVFYAVWTLLAHFRLLRPLIILAVPSIGTLAVWLVFFFDDPSDPGFSSGTAERAVAEELCPGDPHAVEPYLTAIRDSGYYHVQLQANSGRTIAGFSVSRARDDTGEFQVDAEGDRSAYVLALSRNGPGC
jgi:hypothetical protein